MSSTLEETPGLIPFGADNILKNVASFVKKAGELTSDFSGVAFPEDYRPRDGSSASWISLSGTSKNTNRGASASSRAATEHVIHHEMSTVHLSSDAAAVVGEESGKTHAQASADMDDAAPSLFLTFPVGCLIEEIHLIDGSPPMEGTNENRVTSLLIRVYHLDQQELQSREQFRTLSKLIERKRPLWSGRALATGLYAAAVNLKEWAVDVKKQFEERTSRP